jgi:hypothetical protein
MTAAERALQLRCDRLAAGLMAGTVAPASWMGRLFRLRNARADLSARLSAEDLARDEDELREARRQTVLSRSRFARLEAETWTR